jgi:hypothetical protein
MYRDFTNYAHSFILDKIKHTNYHVYTSINLYITKKVLPKLTQKSEVTECHNFKFVQVMKEPGQRPVIEVKRTLHKAISSSPVSNTIPPNSSSSSSVKSSAIVSNLELEMAIDKNSNEYENDSKERYDDEPDSNMSTSNSSNFFKNSTLLPSQTL